jgi:hypothetical protein
MSRYPEGIFVKKKNARKTYERNIKEERRCIEKKLH